MMNKINGSSQCWLIEQMQKTINTMATDLSDNDLDCYYCSHFPDGGDGKCTLYTNGRCQFRWRYADKAEELIDKMRSELNEGTD